MREQWRQDSLANAEKWKQRKIRYEMSMIALKAALKRQSELKYNPNAPVRSQASALKNDQALTNLANRRRRAANAANKRADPYEQHKLASRELQDAWKAENKQIRDAWKAENNQRKIRHEMSTLAMKAALKRQYPRPNAWKAENIKQRKSNGVEMSMPAMKAALNRQYKPNTP
eukprot:1364073-Pyramimonas_sp.AAC.1